MAKVVFLDRDGTINKKAGIHKYIVSPDEVQLLEGAGNAIAKLNECGYKVIVVSNQRGVARGIFSIDDLQSVTKRIQEMLNEYNATIDDFYYCIHDINQCDCRKPKKGLFLQAEENFNIDKKNSYMVGDSMSDVEAGQAYGIHTIKIGEPCGADFFCKNLREAIEWIIESESV